MTSPSRWLPFSPRLRAVAVSFALLLVLAFGFLGSRPLWEPDEGRYTNVAITMLESGNWIDPMRNDDTGHWSKPPATYWALASSFGVFGLNTWAARLPSALAWLACVLLVWLTARRLADGTQTLAALVYATMLLPSAAGQMVTTDFLLSACEALAVYGFVVFRFSASPRRDAGLLVLWLGLALGFMTKGPPALIPLLPIMLLHVLAPRATAARWTWHVAGLALFVLVAAPWYVVVASRHSGLLHYFLGAEVVDRVATDRFGRNGEWYGWLKVYLPTILIGALPWTVDLLRWFGALPRRIGQWRDASVRTAAAPQLFVALWALLPLLVFCIARSRLPLYLLPCFAAFAIAIAGMRHECSTGLPRGPRIASWMIVPWMMALLALRYAASVFPTDADSSAWARAIRERVSAPLRQVVFVEDTARYGLHLYLGAQVERVARETSPTQGFNPTFDESLWRELQETGSGDGAVYVTPEAIWSEVEQAIRARGFRARRLGAPHAGRVIFAVAADRAVP